MSLPGFQPFGTPGGLGPGQPPPQPAEPAPAADVPGPPLAHYLAPQHIDLIRESGISDAVRNDRGYRTATRRRELRDFGFSERQQEVVREPARSSNPAAALVIPVWGVSGEVVLYQIRPDEPFSSSDGKALKYLLPPRAQMALDVHPSVRRQLTDPSVALIITEGVRKGDAGVSIGLCCIALLGVWNFRGTNDLGGKTLLPEFELIAWNGRSVYIAFDSDVMTKPAVHEAMRRLKAIIQSRGAHVQVIYLPVGPHGEKTGLDDYLVAGHSKDELFALATDQLRSPETREPGAQVWHLGDYEMVATKGIFRHDRQGASQQLTDFAALIRRKVIEDDGVEQRQRYELLVQQGNRREDISVAATEFESLRWIRRLNTLDPYLAAGIGTRDHVRAAIDLASKGASERAHVFTHLGWRRLGGGHWAYLHAGGAIGANGPVNGVQVELSGLSGEFARFKLPDPPRGEEAVAAVRLSLSLLALAPDRVMVPLLAAAYRAPLGYVDLSVYVVGRTGVFKSELTALIQQHYGSEFVREQLPGSWVTTANGLRAQLFLAKDAVMTVDDYAPGGGRLDRESLQRKAAEIFRAQGNAAARGRADTAGGLRPSKPPRALLVTSAEDDPAGHSVVARNVIVELGPGEVSVAHLTEAQRVAAAGYFAQAMAGYLSWLAPRLDQVRDSIRDQANKLRDQLRGAHPRTPTSLAQLAIGLHYFLAYAKDVGAIDELSRAQYWQRAWTAFGQLVEIQNKHQTEAEPTTRYFELLMAAVTTGRAHFAIRDGKAPPNAGAYGWREHVNAFGREWRPQGERIGWLDGRDLYVEPVGGYRAAQAMAGDDVGIGVGQKALTKRLKERGLLTTTGAKEPRVQRAIEGENKRVLHLSVDTVWAHTGGGSAESAARGEMGPPAAPGEFGEGRPEPISQPIFAADPLPQTGGSAAGIGCEEGVAEFKQDARQPKQPIQPISRGTEAYMETTAPACPTCGPTDEGYRPLGGDRRLCLRCGKEWGQGA